MIEKGTEFLPPYIQMIIKKSGGIGFENLGRNKNERQTKQNPMRPKM